MLVMLQESVPKLCTFLLQATPTATPPFYQLAQIVNHLSSGSWPAFTLNLCKSVNPLGSYAPFLQFLPRPFLDNWHEHKHTPSHTLSHTHTHTHTHTLDFHASFQLLRTKTLTAQEWGIFVDRLTESNLQSCWSQLKTVFGKLSAVRSEDYAN